MYDTRGFCMDLDAQNSPQFWFEETVAHAAKIPGSCSIGPSFNDLPFVRKFARKVRIAREVEGIDLASHSDIRVNAQACLCFMLHTRKKCAAGQLAGPFKLDASLATPASRLVTTQVCHTRT